MARDSYPFPLTVTDTDIEKVAGKGAYLGMVRESPDGKKYLLVRNNASGTLATNPIILRFVNGGGFTIAAAGANEPCDGIHSIGVPVVTNAYFWMQTDGIASLTGTQTKGKFVGSIGAGVGGDLTPTYSINEGGVDTHTLAGYIGIAAEDASTTGAVYIRPGFILV
jgi:hypothetical protein